MMRKNFEPTHAFHRKPWIILLRQQPCFSKLTEAQLTHIINLATIKTYSHGEYIVKEGETVDSIAIVLEGRAEVIKNENVILAVLNKNDLIGFDGYDLYTKTGKRTASIKATSIFRILNITLENLESLFTAYSSPEFAPGTLLEKIQKMLFIKRIYAFENLSLDTLNYLVQKVEHKIFSRDEIIFSEGEQANYCYTIIKGYVDISRKTHHRKKFIARLGPYDIFGEIAILSGEKRNANAVAKTECECLLLKKEDLEKIIMDSVASLKALKKIFLERSRPVKNLQVETYFRQNESGEKIAILKEPVVGNYFKLSPHGLYVWHLVDGKKNIKEITLKFYEKFHLFSPQFIFKIILELLKFKFIQMPSLEETEKKINSTEKIKWWNKLKSYMEYFHPIPTPDLWLEKSYQKFVYLFFTPVAKIIYLLIITAGLLAFFSTTPTAINTLRETPHAWVFLLSFIPLSLVGACLHELAHAYTTKHFGKKIYGMGIGWYWLSGIAYVDTSDMWLGTRAERIAVALAGIFMDIIYSSIFAIAGYFSASPIIQLICWFIAINGYLSVLYNLDPIYEFDGYHFLMNYFNKNHLRESSIYFLGHHEKFNIFNKSFWQEYGIEIKYWLICFTYLIFICITSYFVQHLILASFLPQYVAQWFEFTTFGWVIPSLVLIVSIISIYSEMKRLDEKI